MVLRKNEWVSVGKILHFRDRNKEFYHFAEFLAFFSIEYNRKAALNAALNL